MRTQFTAARHEFHAFGRGQIVARFYAERLTFDGGGIRLREVARRLGVTDRGPFPGRSRPAQGGALCDVAGGAGGVRDRVGRGSFGPWRRARARTINGPWPHRSTGSAKLVCDAGRMRDPAVGRPRMADAFQSSAVEIWAVLGVFRGAQGLSHDFRHESFRVAAGVDAGSMCRRSFEAN